MTEGDNQGRELELTHLPVVAQVDRVRSMRCVGKPGSTRIDSPVAVAAFVTPLGALWRELDLSHRERTGGGNQAEEQSMSTKDSAFR